MQFFIMQLFVFFLFKKKSSYHDSGIKCELS